MKWFKFYGQDFLTDPKILQLSVTDRMCWVILLCYASVNDNGMITFLSEYQLMVSAGIDPMSEEWDRTKGVLNRFISLEMIRIDNGLITILNWEKRQETSLTPYERVKRHRARHKEDNADNENDNDRIRIDKNRIDKIRIKKDNDVSFDKFWKEYPRHVAKEKARSSFEKINPDAELLKKILLAIENQKKTDQWKKDKGQFIPHPATWLNQKRWEDEVDVPLGKLINNAPRSAPGKYGRFN